MKILFITTSYNNARFLGPTLFAILDQKGEWDKEILVIDDGSRDNSIEIIQKLAQEYPQITLIQQKNQGSAAAVNRGLERIGNHDFVALVESDVKIEKAWLSKNIKHFSKPQIGGVGGKLSPFPNDNWIARLAGYEVEYKMEKQSAHPKHLTAANVIYRAEVFKKVGFFREELKNSAADNEFNLRVIKTGFQLVLNKKARAWHHYKSSLFSFLRRSYAYARYRAFLKGVNSYPYDRIITLQVVLILALVVLILLNLFTKSFWGAVTLVLVALIYFSLTFPPLIWTLRHKKDTVMLVYPLLSLLRNSAALLGLGAGVVYFLINKNKKS